jgi:uncharacterized repeat protein (TIGR01451 family)
MKKVLQAVMVMLLLPTAVWSQQKGGIEIKTVSEIEMTQTDAEGKKEVKRIDATTKNVAPGQTVFFTDYYTYSGDKPATDVVIKNPVPEHMVYVDGSAAGKGTKIEFSIDQGKTFAAADKLKVKSADGKERRAAAADYTHIRWTIEKPLQKGAKGSVSFRATVK